MEAERERGERDAHIVVGGKKREAPKSRQARVKGRVCPTRFTRLRPRALAPFFFPPTTMVSPTMALSGDLGTHWRPRHPLGDPPRGYRRCPRRWPLGSCPLGQSRKAATTPFHRPSPGIARRRRAPAPVACPHTRAPRPCAPGWTVDLPGRPAWARPCPLAPSAGHTAGGRQHGVQLGRWYVGLTLLRLVLAADCSSRVSSSPYAPLAESTNKLSVLILPAN